MHKINLKSRRKKNIYPKITIAVLIILVLILSKATWSVFIKNKETGENLQETTEDLNSLNNRRSDLEKEIEGLSTERGIDREIRTKFRVVKDNEEMIMLINSPEDSTSSTTDDKQGFWSRILDLF